MPRPATRAKAVAASAAAASAAAATVETTQGRNLYQTAAQTGNTGNQERAPESSRGDKT